MRLFLAALLMVCAAAGAQPREGHVSPGDPLILRPAEGGDARLAESAARQAGSKEAAANHEVARGWRQLKQGDTEVAIQSFNQAYLLNPNHAEVYWGLGVAMTEQAQYAIAARLFQRALTLAPDNPRLLADVGLAHTRAAIGASTDPIEQAKHLQGALPWFDAAEKLDPSYAAVYANRAVTLYLLERLGESWANIDRAEALDPSSVDPKLVADLSAKMPRPGAMSASAPTDGATVKTEAVTEPPRVQQAELPAAVPAEEKAAPAKQAAPATAPPPAPRSLHVISAEPPSGAGPDKRHCLELPTNEAIMRCVYPRK